MTILCEFTPTGGDTIRCSMTDFADIHLWKSFIVSIASIKVSMPSKWGGFADPSFSDISFSPDMFADIWPPPATAAIKFRWLGSSTDENAGTVIFDGTATRGELARDYVKYTLKRPENATKVAAATAYADTLVNVMTTLCGASYLNLTLDSTLSRSPSPAVSYTTTAEQLTVDLASDLCAFFSHGFYVDGTTLYLVDMKDIATPTELDEWSILPSAYKYEKPYSTCKCGDYSAASATVENGEELTISTAYHGTEANIEAALADILEIANRPTIELNSMISDSPPTIGGCYSFTDESHYQPLTVTARISDAVYNFDNEMMQSTGAGAIA